MTITDLIQALAAAGATTQAIAIAVQAVEEERAAVDAHRAAARARKRKERDMSRDSHATVTRQNAETAATVTRQSRDMSRDSHATVTRQSRDSHATQPPDGPLSPCTPYPPLIPPSDADASAGQPAAAAKQDTPSLLPPDPIKALFDTGLQVLAGSQTPAQARAVVGQLRKAKGDDQAMQVLLAAARSTDPLPYIQAAIRGRPPAQPRMPGQVL